MKKDIHPKYETTKAVCVCGNEFEVGSTKKDLTVELCHMCHPFYTGKQKLVDTARRVEKFQAKLAKKDTAAKGKLGKTVKNAKRALKKADNKKNK